MENNNDNFTISLKDDNRGIGVVEIVLILVEKPNAKYRYVLCGN